MGASAGDLRSSCMNISIRFALLCFSALLASCAGNMSATPQAGAPVTSESQQRDVIPQTTLAPTAFTIATLPFNFRVDLGNGHPKLNNASAVVGQDHCPSGINACAAVYRNGQVTHPFGGDGVVSNALAINDSGDVIGADDFGHNPVLYKGGKVSSLSNQGGTAARH